MQRELVVSLADLRHISIKCLHCNTRVILDMREKSAFAEKHNFFAPKVCPGCQAPYDSAVPTNVDYLQKIYQSLLPLAGTIGFYGEIEELATQAKQGRNC